jgi:shikimate kinase
MEKPKDFPGNLVLIGMFGSGKTTVGRILAFHLRYHFLDVDHLIESRFHKPLQKVLESLGMEGFMKMEEETLLALHPRHCVVATGGSAVYYPKAMAHLRTLGPRVYLKVPLPELKRRIPEFTNRGTVRRGGETLPELFRERTPLLEKYADVTIKAHGRSWEDMSLDLLERFGVRTLPPKTPTPKPPRSSGPRPGSGKRPPRRRKG